MNNRRPGLRSQLSDAYAENRRLRNALEEVNRPAAVRVEQLEQEVGRLKHELEEIRTGQLRERRMYAEALGRAQERIDVYRRALVAGAAAVVDIASGKA